MIETGKELAAASRKLAENYKTVYALGCFGWPMNTANQNRAVQSYAYNQNADRESKIRGASEDTFAFDCVGMIKALLWGWKGCTEKPYGGAVYVSNGVPDKNANQMMGLCLEPSTEFSSIQVGEVVWMKGHIGVYIGDGLAVECTPRWKDGVQITAVHNIGKKQGYNGRTWTSHGKLPYLRYEDRYSLKMRMLRQGTKGEDVRSLQYLLIAKGYDCGLWGADGDFGSQTYRAVTLFQRGNALDADGIAGPKTMATLLGVAGNE